MIGLGLSIPQVAVRRILNSIPAWLPTADTATPDLFADFTTEGSTNHYWYNNLQKSNFAALLSAASGTFSRTSTAYYTNSSGVLASASSGTLRFDYDPVALTSNGIFLEGSRTNSVLQSNNFNTTWTTNALTSKVQNATGPDGTTSAWTLTTDGAGFPFVAQSIALNGSANSVYAKAGTAGFLIIRTDDAGGQRRTWFNLTTGAVGTTTSISSPVIAHSPTITPAGNGWYRCSANASGAAQTNFIIGFSDADANINCTNGHTVFFAFAADELGKFPSSYIATTTGSASRSADSLSYGQSKPTQTTKSIAFITPPGLTTAKALWTMDDGSSNNLIEASIGYGTANHLNIDIYSGGVLSATLDMGAVTANTAYKLALAAKASSYRASLNGGAVVSAASGAMPAAITTERLGSEAAAGAEWYGRIKSFGSWQTTFASDAALQSLST